MLFNSYLFIFLFLPLSLLGYFGLNHMGKPKAALVFLTGMSLWFCGFGSLSYLVILLFSILLNYGIVALMNRAKNRGARKLCLLGGISVNIGILFCFKYYDFFIENLNSALKTGFPLLHLALPLGISFYTFQQLSYVIDSYKGECGHYGFLEYAAYASFFPKLIQGPITGHRELILQLRDDTRKKPDFVNLSQGLYAFSLGLAKKVLLADTLSGPVSLGYANIGELNSVSALTVMICYSLQIYFDFSGYCDMACGMALMMNLRLPLNFNSPYRAQSVSDFWDRWHMTLTKFFTKYIYFPLGGSRCGKLKTCRNVLIVFLLSGLWHGASWTFVLWGVMHGLVSVFEKMANIRSWKAPKALKVGLTFLFVTFAWSLFRAGSFAEASALWHRLLFAGPGPLYPPITDSFRDLVEASFLYRAGLGGLMNRFPWMMPALFIGAALLSCFLMKNTQEKMEKMEFSAGKCIAAAVLLVWSVLSLSEISEFIYFNF